MLLPCFYNAPVSWYALLKENPGNITIEQFDNYSKQTYRNRCRILGANGIINLVIPVVKDHGKKTMTKDIRIDYDMPWHKNHWNSIISAYASAPFFEYYYDSFISFYQKKHKYLLDYNLGLINTALDILNIKTNFTLSESYQHLDTKNDIRQLIHPKKEFIHPEYSFIQKEYQQVFMDKHGFAKDLSIIDLIFNEGPNAASLLSASLFSKQG